MFTQRISMDCTQEQYEKYLKEELLKMGYKEVGIDWYDWEDVIVNNLNGCVGHIGSATKSNNSRYDRLYLGSFNAPLFLALAAMTDSPTGNYRECYTNGIDLFLPFTSGVYYGGIWRKATKEEIMAKFSEKKCNHNTLENKIDQLNEKGKVEVNISFDATELESEIINWFKNDTQDLSESPIYFHRNQSGSNDGLRVQNIDLAIKILKSNGYKILKKKETWEEV